MFIKEQAYKARRCDSIMFIKENDALVVWNNPQLYYKYVTTLQSGTSAHSLFSVSVSSFIRRLQKLFQLRLEASKTFPASFGGFKKFFPGHVGGFSVNPDPDY